MVSAAIVKLHSDLYEIAEPNHETKRAHSDAQCIKVY